MVVMRDGASGAPPSTTAALGQHLCAHRPPMARMVTRWPRETAAVSFSSHLTAGEGSLPTARPPLWARDGVGGAARRDGGGPERAFSRSSADDGADVGTRASGDKGGFVSGPAVDGGELSPTEWEGSTPTGPHPNGSATASGAWRAASAARGMNSARRQPLRAPRSGFRPRIRAASTPSTGPGRLDSWRQPLRPRRWIGPRPRTAPWRVLRPRPLSPFECPAREGGRRPWLRLGGISG